MVSIFNTTQKKVSYKTLLFLGTILSLFLLSTSFTYAIGPDIKQFFFETCISIGGFFAGLGGILFDIAIRSVVLEMGNWFVHEGIGAVVTSIWTMIRDLFNILFIFSLVYIGLRTILDSDDSRTKKMLGMLIAAALLINFSLYIAKVVVDVSNFTAIEIHKTATKGISGSYGIINKNSDGTDAGGFTTADKSIAGAYMDVLNISTWIQDNNGDGPNVVVYSLFAMFFLMFLGFVLLYGGIMLIARFIAIIFYLIFSPFMFLGWVLPQFQSYATKWWKGFLGYSFFAPVYIFMLYIGLYALQQIQNGLVGEANYSRAFGDGGFSVSNFDVFLMYAIGVGFLIGATKVASAMSNGGAAIGMNMADKFSQKFTTGIGARIGLGAAASTGGFAYRQTGGRLGKGLQNVSEAREKRTGKSSMFTRGLRAGGESMQSKKIAGATSYKEKNEAIKTGHTRASRAAKVHEYTNTLTLDDSTAENRAKKQEAFANMSDPQLIEIAKTSSGRKLIKDNAQMLSSNQMQAISKSDDINDTDTGSIGAAHQTKMKVHVSSNGGVGKASSDQLNSLGIDELSLPKNAVNLTDDKIDKLKLVDEHKRTLKQARETALLSVVHTGTPVGGKSIADLAKMSPSKVAELPDKVFYAPNAAALPYVKSFLKGLSFNALEEVGRKKNSEVARQIRGILASEASAGAPANSYERELYNWLNIDRIGKKFGR